MAVRSPIVAVLGHVDHGKSSVLDAIRGSNIVATEAGRITQAIGASIVPTATIKQRCGPLLDALKLTITLPGLLFIDTPGHAAFTTLRRRGGSLADIAVVVVDINDGFKPQTIEAIEILRAAKTPFVIAANKMDLVHGYRKQADIVLQDIQRQEPAWITAFETRLYELVGKLHERFQMNADRFDRVEDFTKQVAIVPTSATTGQGINELLVVLAGLAQRFLEQQLRLNVEGPGKGTVLEVKETTGFGTTIDVILYDGVIRKNDTIVIGGIDEPVVTKVRAILEPAPLHEMRDKKSKYASKEQAVAAIGVKIAAPELERVVAGMPLRVAGKDDIERIGAELQAEVSEVMITTDKEGVVIKADTLGSLEALIVLLREKQIPIKRASVGQISKKDLAEVEANYDANPRYAVLLGFNLTDVPSTERAKIITGPVIYELIDKIEEWQQEIARREQAQQLEFLTRPCKIELLPNCVFRQSNPCVVGVEVLAGTLTINMPLMNRQGERVTSVKSLQRAKESISSAVFGEQIAVSMPDVVAGRHVHEGDILYSAITEEQFRQLKQLVKLLSEKERAILKEIAEIKRSENPLWGV